MTRAGFPHSDTPGSQLGCQLPRAYRRLQRPSSALDAKASTMCPSQLVSQTLNKNNKRHNPTTRQSTGSRATTKRSDNHHHTTTPTQNQGEPAHQSLPDARVHYPLLKHPTHQPPPGTTQAPTRERRHRTTQPTPPEPTSRQSPPAGPRA